MESKSRHRGWVSTIPAVVSGATVFVLLSGTYFYGFSFGLMPEIRGLNLHDHLTVSDYTTTAIGTFSNPLMFVAVFLLTRLFLLLDEDAEYAENMNSNPPFRLDIGAFLRGTGYLKDSLKKPYIALAIIVSLVWVTLASCSLLVSCDFIDERDAFSVLLVLTISVVIYFAPYVVFGRLFFSIKRSSDSTYDINRRKKLMSTMIGLGYVFFLLSFLGWCFLSKIPDLVEPVGTFFFAAFYAPLDSTY